jgi:predicted transposase/invertase (TIGR01784 family)
MQFINPKTDYAFKRIFGSIESHDILISFLNAILYQEQEKIVELEILNPYSPGTTFDLKDTYLDVKATLNDRHIVLIEMQLNPKAAFDKRVLYNGAKMYANQLEMAANYSSLKPVIALTIVDFNFIKDSNKIINYFILKNRETNEVYKNEDLELVFVELPKFTKKLNELENLTDKWLYFLKHCAEFTEKPYMMEIVPSLNKALEIANRVNLSLEELEEIQKRMIWLADQENELLEAEEKGIKKGLQQGLQQGKVELIISLLENILGEIPQEMIDKIVNLSPEKLENITQSIFNIKTLNQLESLLK